jgi:predicted GH43/DUF377 family glycosyl hydrolase
MKKYLSLLTTILSLVFFTLPALEMLDSNDNPYKIIKSTKRLYLPACPGANNPSIMEFEDNYLLTFRWTPKHWDEPWISFIGIVILDKSLNQISKVELLDTRLYNRTTPSQSEDARILSVNGKIYLLYNDNMKIIFPTHWERRDMYAVELIYQNNEFILGEPLRLRHAKKYREKPWQKNWTPFEWQNKLLLSYAINPHEVLLPNLETGNCNSFFESNKKINWDYGEIRGGTPGILVDGEYLAFFHSGEIKQTPASEFHELWHYFMGAYTFSAEPPFELTKISPEPLSVPEFYTYSYYSKRVIYPGGFVVYGPNIYLAYGKDDCEVWIATIDIKELKNSLVPLK